MASDETWSKLRYFKKDSKTDKWGDPDLISDELLLRLDDFRHWLGSPVIVLHAVKTSGHASKSYHYPQNGACAVDIIIPQYDQTPWDLVMDATRFGFTGIGYYPHWRYKDKACGGLHLDTRPLKWDSDGSKNYNHSRWLGVLIDNKQEYVELDFHNMLKYCSPADLPISQLN